MLYEGWVMSIKRAHDNGIIMIHTSSFYTETLHYRCRQGSPFLCLCLFTMNQAAEPKEA